MSTWILVADSSRARVFCAKRKSESFHEVADPVHTASRLHGQSLETDDAGRAFDSAGDGRHSMGAEKKQHQNEIETFARELAEYLAAGLREDQYTRLYIAAPPAFLGTLRTLLSAEVSGAVIAEVDKDIVMQPLEQITSYFPE